MLKKRRKWLPLGISLVLLLLFGLSQFYAYIMKDQWNERSEAKEIARARAGLTEVSKAQKSVWDENAIYWVLTGKNDAGTKLMVWVRFTKEGQPAGGENDLYAEELSKGTSEAQIRDIIAAQLPGITIKRPPSRECITENMPGGCSTKRTAGSITASIASQTAVPSVKGIACPTGKRQQEWTTAGAGDS